MPQPHTSRFDCLAGGQGHPLVPHVCGSYILGGEWRVRRRIRWLTIIIRLKEKTIGYGIAMVGPGAEKKKPANDYNVE